MRLSKRRLVPILGVAAVVVSVGLVRIPAADAAVPTITGPAAVFTVPNVPIAFTGLDIISSEQKTITTNATSGGSCNATANPPVLTQCVSVKLDVGHGKLSYNASGVESTVGDPTGNAVQQFAGTAAAVNSALATVVYKPDSGYENLPGTPAFLQVDVIDGPTGDSTGSGSPSKSLIVAIRVAPLNSFPTNTVPADQSVPGGADTTFPGNAFDVADSDAEKGESDDRLLLVLWTDCGTFDISGGNFTIGQDIKNLLVNQVGFDQTEADTIYSALPASVQNLALQTSGSNVSAVAGVGHLQDVKDALSSVTFHAPSTPGTCTVQQFVTDLGNNGLPGHYVNVSHDPGLNPTGVELPALGVDLSSTKFTVTGPTVTIDQAAGQADPTGASPIVFDIVFSEPVDGFAASDVVLSGTAGATTATLSGGPTSYTMQVSGMTGAGTVIATIPADVANATAAGKTGNEASTSTDDTVTYTVAAPATPSVMIDQGAAQADPTGVAPIVFDVVFSEAVDGFAASDVVLSGTAGANVATLSGGPSNYTLQVSGMTGAGTVIATIPANIATAVAAGNTSNTASTSTDNTVTFTVAAPTTPSVTIDQAAAQADPTATSPIAFDVVFSEPVDGFAASDVVLSGTAGANVATLSGGPSNYTLQVSGMTGDGTVIATIPAGVATAVAAGNTGNAASTSTDNTVTFTVAAPTTPTVTIDQAAGQADPTGVAPIVFDVVFSEPVDGFAAADVVLSGTAGATTATLSAGPTSYTLQVSGMTGAGTVIATIPAAIATAVAAGNTGNTASTSTDNTVTFTVAAPATPSVTIDQAAAQADPTGVSPIVFDVVFSEPVDGFAASDVVLSGTAGANVATLSSGPSNYTLQVSGMTGAGTVIATIPADVAAAVAAGNTGNAASTSTDNTVTFTVAAPTTPSVTIDQAAAQADPTATSPIVFDIVFSEPVDGFAASDVVLSGTAGATTATLSAGPTSYTLQVSGMTSAGTVIATIPADVANATAAGKTGNEASTSTDNTVTFTVAGPTTGPPTTGPPTTEPPTTGPLTTGPPDTTAHPSTSGAGIDAESSSNAGSGSGPLATTGSSITALLALGLGLLVFGVLALSGASRRRLRRH